MGCYHPPLQKNYYKHLEFEIIRLEGNAFDPTHSKSVLAGGMAFLGMVSGRTYASH